MSLKTGQQTHKANNKTQRRESTVAGGTVGMQDKQAGLTTHEYLLNDLEEIPSSNTP